MKNKNTKPKYLFISQYKDKLNSPINSYWNGFGWNEEENFYIENNYKYQGFIHLRKEKLEKIKKLFNNN